MFEYIDKTRNDCFLLIHSTKIENKKSVSTMFYLLRVLINRHKKIATQSFESP
jgi:hypothetical protein